MNLEKLINPLRRTDVLVSMGVSVVTGIGIGVFGDRLYQKRYHPTIKDQTKEIDLHIKRMEKKLLDNAEVWDNERKALQSAFVREMETQMTKFLKNVQSVSQELAVQDQAVIEEAEEKQVSVFQTPDDSWDWQVDPKNRNSAEPYIIHREEFEVNELDFMQDTLTYYAADDILTDSKDVPVYDHQKKLGVLRFGHGSGDPSVCFVRNEQLGVEWEVCLDHGSYAQQVLGEQIEEDLELKHHHSSTPKFRME